MSDLVQRLKDACAGHPNAEIPWPHRLLHEAAAEIERLRERLAVWPVDPRAGAFLKDQPILSEDCDGIACRDETIRVLDEQRVKMRAEIEHARIAYGRQFNAISKALACLDDVKTAALNDEPEEAGSKVIEAMEILAMSDARFHDQPGLKGWNDSE